MTNRIRLPSPSPHRRTAGFHSLEAGFFCWLRITGSGWRNIRSGQGRLCESVSTTSQRSAPDAGSCRCRCLAASRSHVVSPAREIDDTNSPRGNASCCPMAADSSRIRATRSNWQSSVPRANTWIRSDCSADQETPCDGPALRRKRMKGQDAPRRPRIKRGQDGKETDQAGSTDGA